MNDVNYRSPLYIQLREVIRSKIEEGEYPAGTAIPSENQLSEQYGINRVSVRSALAALENEGCCDPYTPGHHCCPPPPGRAPPPPASGPGLLQALGSPACLCWNSGPSTLA